jgi:DNA invertase Pin-like site-specific DNA recombinase
MIKLVGGFYGRQSDDESDITRDNQLKWCRKFIPTVEGWLSEEYRQPVRITLPDHLVFFDRDKSGIVYQRPDYDRCKAAIAAGEIDILLLHALDRMARGIPFKTISELEFCISHNVRVFSQSEENEVTSQDEFNILHTVLDSIQANKEWKRIRKRTLEGRFTSWEKDNSRMSFGRRPRLGYDLDENKHIVIVPEEAKIVNQIFDMVLEGLAYSEISYRLNQHDIPTTTAIRGERPNSRWSPSGVSRVVNCDEYALGRMAFEVNDGSDERVDVVVPIPVIVDPERFYAAQHVIEKRQRTRRRVHQYLLKGALHCLDCDNDFICTTGHYGCRGRVHAKRWGSDPCQMPYIPPVKIDPIAWQDVMAFISKPELLYDAFVTHSTAQVREINDRLSHIETGIERKRRAKTRLALDFAMEQFSDDEIKAARRTIDEEIAGLEKEAIELQISRAILQQHEQKFDRLDYLSGIDLNRLPYEGQVALVMEMVHHVAVKQSDFGVVITVHYHLLDPGSITSHQSQQSLTYKTQSHEVYL